MEFYKAIAIRFIKGFLAGGIGSAAAIITQGFMIKSTEDIQVFSVSLAAAFISGGLLGIQKMITWKDEQPS